VLTEGSTILGFDCTYACQCMTINQFHPTCILTTHLPKSKIILSSHLLLSYMWLFPRGLLTNILYTFLVALPDDKISPLQQVKFHSNLYKLTSSSLCNILRTYLILFQNLVSSALGRFNLCECSYLTFCNILA